jgi:hypothetical protein
MMEADEEKMIVTAGYGDFAIVVGWISFVFGGLAAIGFFAAGAGTPAIGYHLAMALLSIAGGVISLALFAVLGEISLHLAALRRQGAPGNGLTDGQFGSGDLGQEN